MAGTLTISTLSDGTNSTSATNPIRGSAKAWARWNGVSGVSINASYNVSSITRPSTGVYIINFTIAMSDTNYAVSGSGRDSQGPVATVGTFNTTSLSVTFVNPNVAVQDCSTASIIIFR